MTQRSYLSHTPRPRSLADIADEAASDFDDAPSEAEDALDVLRCLEGVNDRASDGRTGYQYVRDFLRNSALWKGDVAKRIKHELRQKIGVA